MVLGAMPFAARAQTPPDPFRTDATLRKETAGYADPLGHDCAIPGGKLTFPAAVDLALCRNPQTRAAWAAAHQQAAALGSTESAWLPSVSATGAVSREFGEHVDVTGQTEAGPQNSADASVNLTWTLYDFGARTGRIKSARALLDAAAATVSSVSQQLIRQVVQSYYGAVAGDANLAATQATEAAAAGSLEVARSLREGGVGTLADVLQAETAHDQAVLNRLQASAAAMSARGTLAVTLGQTAEQPFILDPEPIPAEVPALTARMADLMAEAVRQRPDLAAARAQRDSAEADITVARAVGRPSITVGALHTFNYQQGVPNLDYNQIGINVTVPLFTGFNVGYGVRQAEAALQSREANLDQVGLSVTLDVWNGYYNLDSANQQLSATAALIKTAEENEQVALGRYRAGVGSIVDVLTAQTGAATARTVRINAELGWKMARAQLALALGRLSSAEPLTGDKPVP
jgi:TolC family type I secretion outer membrane protein